MLHSIRPILTLLLLASVMAVLPAASGAAQVATPAATPTAKPQPPTQPTTGPGSSEALFGGVIAIEQIPAGQSEANYWLFVPTDPRPGTTRAGEPFPVVIFLGGKGASNADAYLVWIEHLVQRGAVVIYPHYQQGLSGGQPASQQKQLEDDVRRALETLEQEGVPVDLTQVAVVGHSLGAERAMEYAATAAAAGLSVPKAVMSIDLLCQSNKGACLGVDLGTIPATTHLLLVTEEKRFYAAGPVVRIWAELRSVPLENRDVIRLVTDEHGKPPLSAWHLQALANDDYYPPDAFDWYGTWKWLDALVGCAFNGEWCEYALGNTPEQRYMGTWSDGMPVMEAVVTDDPA